MLNKITFFLIFFISSHASFANDEQKALIKKANDGEAKAQFLLAQSYFYGDYGSSDKEEAQKWYIKAADQGHVVAKFRVAIYSLQNKKPYTTEEAFKLIEESAEAGYIVAQTSLAHMLNDPYTDPWLKDSIKSRKWYLTAAEQEDHDAQYHIGHMYNFGIGGEKDIPKAYKWLRLSAEQDHSGAKDLLDVLLKTISEEDLAKGKKLYDSFEPVTSKFDIVKGS